MSCITWFIVYLQSLNTERGRERPVKYCGLLQSWGRNRLQLPLKIKGNIIIRTNTQYLLMFTILTNKGKSSELYSLLKTWQRVYLQSVPSLFYYLSQNKNFNIATSQPVFRDYNTSNISTKKNC